MRKQLFHSQLLMILVLFMLSFSIMTNPVIAGPGNSDDKGFSDDSPGNSEDSPGPGTPNQGTDEQEQPAAGEDNQPQQEKNQQQQNNNENNDDQNSHDDQQHHYRYQQGDRDGDNVNDEQERFQQRNMTMIQEHNRTRIRSEWIGERDQDAFELFLSTENGIHIWFEYIPTTNNEQTDLRFDISFSQLFEYTDENTNGRYDGNDTILSNYSLLDQEYTILNYSTIIAQDNETITCIQTNTLDDLFSIVLYVTGNYSQIQNQVISPSEIKIDFIITNYSFTENDSFLNLQSDLITLHTVDIQSESFDETQGHATDEHQLEISSLNHTAFFSWLQTASVDNETKDVNVTVISSIQQSIINNTKEWSKISTIYFCYPPGENIIHDPKIGVESISYASFASLISKELIVEHNIFAFFGILLIATLMFVTVVYMRKTQ